METRDTALLTRLRGWFGIEAEEHLQAISTTLLSLERGAHGEDERRLLEALFREVHTLKGAARAVNLGEIEAICQAVEGVCARLKRGEVKAGAEAFDTFHRAVDVVRQLSGSAVEGGGGKQVAELIAAVTQLETHGLSQGITKSPFRLVQEPQPGGSVTLETSKTERSAANKGDQEALLLKLRGLFGIEAEEHLQAISTTLLSLERGAQGEDERRLLEALFRE